MHFFDDEFEFHGVDIGHDAVIEIKDVFTVIGFGGFKNASSFFNDDFIVGVKHGVKEIALNTFSGFYLGNINGFTDG